MAELPSRQRFLLIRHGESFANISPRDLRSVDAGLTDAKLTRCGEAQAREMGTMVRSRCLQDLTRNKNSKDTGCKSAFSPTIVVVSPFTRTLQTACYLTEKWGASRPPLVIEPLLREYYPKFLPELIGRPQTWLRSCPTLIKHSVFSECQWDGVPEGYTSWWAPTGKAHLDTTDLKAGARRMRHFVGKMRLTNHRDIVVVAHGTALSRAMQARVKTWGNCEASASRN